MAYLDRFIATDDLVAHLNPFVISITDTAIQAKYAGFLSVSAVTVYELAIKDIFINFAQRKNGVFGNFVEKHFSNINGRIKIDDLKGQHIQPFGTNYLNKFETKLQARERILLVTARKNLRSEYSNLIICRHKFVHGGSPTLTFQEVLSSYETGKQVIHSLHDAMQR